jgi:arylsulfatase A-like enzyme
MMLRLLQIVVFSFLFLISCSDQTGKQETSVSPNIVLIYLDDMGYGDLSLTGVTGYTIPNLDKIATNGMFFTHFYSPQAVCSASRAGLFTECYPNRIGFAGGH